MNFPRKALRAAVVAVTLSALCVTGAGAVYIGVGTVTASSGLRLRSGPSTDSSTVTSVTPGEKVVVRTNMGEGWYKVFYKGQVGYMLGEYLDIDPNGFGSQLGNGVVKTSGALNVRSAPGTDQPRVGQLPAGTVVKIVGMDSGWFHIVWGDIDGYVSSDYMSVTSEAVSAVPAKAETPKPAPTPAPTPKPTPTPTPTPAPVQQAAAESQPSQEPAPVESAQPEQPAETPAAEAPAEETPAAEQQPADTSKGEEIVSYAKGFLGVPYVWGANGPNSFDCSGFTSYVYAHFGYSLKRTVPGQMESGSSVEWNAWQPGDLIFFSSNGKRGTHVGIYVGDGKFIHASTNGTNEVKISELTTGYYSRVYFGSRRII